MTEQQLTTDSIDGGGTDVTRKPTVSEQTKQDAKLRAIFNKQQGAAKAREAKAAKAAAGKASQAAPPPKDLPTDEMTDEEAWDMNQARSDAKAEPKQPPKPDEPEADDDGETKENDPEMDKALSALRRYGLGDVAASWDRETVLTKGAKLLKIQADNDSLRAGSKQADQAQDAAQKPEKQEPAGDTASTPAPYLKELRAALKADGLSDQTAEILEKSITRLASTVSAPAIEQLKAENEALKAAVSERQVAEQMRALEGSRSRLKERFQGLADQSVFDTVVEHMGIIANAKKYAVYDTVDQRLDAIMEDALKWLQQPEAAASEDQEAERRVRRAGKSLVSQRTHKPRPMTPQERMRATFDHLQKRPGDTAGARRAAGL